MRITVAEARTNFDRVLEAVRNGEQVTIVENDRAVVEMTPVAEARASDTDPVEAFLALRRDGGLPATVDEVIEWTREGRR